MNELERLSIEKQRALSWLDELYARNTYGKTPEEKAALALQVRKAERDYWAAARAFDKELTERAKA